MQGSNTDTPQGPPKRRSYVIDRGFQLKYTVMLVLLGTLVSVLFGTMAYVAHLDARSTLEVAPPLMASLDAAFAQAEATFVWLMVGITVLMAGALALVGVLITHRVAGPVYVMSHYVNVLSNGRYPIMRKLRAADELKDFFERFQGAIDAMRAREATEAEQLGRAIEALSQGASGEAGREALAELREMYERKRDATDRVDVGRAVA